MATHGATITWQRGDEAFLDNRYSRAHLWRFDGGLEVPASSSPHVVRVPFSNPANVDPEEAYVAALSSCRTSTPRNAMRRSSSTGAIGSRCACGTM